MRTVRAGMILNPQGLAGAPGQTPQRCAAMLRLRFCALL